MTPKLYIEGLPDWALGESGLYFRLNRDDVSLVEFRLDCGMCNGAYDLAATLKRPWPEAWPQVETIYSDEPPYVTERLYWGDRP